MSREFLLLSMLRFAKLGLAVVSLVIYGRVFGVGVQMDAWVFASGIVASAGMLAWGPVNEIARSRFLQQVASDGFEQATRHATRLLRLTAMGSALLAIILWILGAHVVDRLYVGADEQSAKVVLQVFSLLLPTLVLGQMHALITAYLNCCEVIYAPELIGISAGLFSLLSVVLGASTWGVHALVIAHYAGLLISLIGTWWLLSRRRFLDATWRPMINIGERDYIHFAAPLYFSYSAGQANAVLERSIATSLGAGTVSSLNYAAQIKSTLQAVITSVLFSLAVPRLTKAMSGRQEQDFKPAWREVQSLVILFLIMVLPPIISGSSLIVGVLFGSGRLDDSQANIVSTLIWSYMLALIPVSLYLVHGSALLALQKGRTYAVWGVLSQVVSALLLLVLLPHLGIQAFPAALFVSHTMAAIAMARAVGPSGILWRDFGLFLLLFFVLVQSEKFLFEWLLVRLHEPIATLALGLAAHGVFAIFFLVYKRHLLRS